PRRRRRFRPLWTFAGIFALGLFATWLSSRRIQPMEEWEGFLDDDELPPRGRQPFPSTPLDVPGPAGTLHVEDGGSGGLPVVFVHGLGGRAAQWEEQLARLRPSRRALALDLRGHGASAPAAGAAYAIADFAADVVAVADELGLERFVLAGHSLGASVAIEVARREGAERVAGLLLVDPNGDQTKIPRRQLDDLLAAIRAAPGEEMRWSFQQVLVGAAPEVAERVLADLAATPDEVLVAALESSFDYSPADALADYEGPVASIVSDMNSLPYSLHELVDDLPVRTVPGTSHWLMLDRPEELGELIDGFLARLDG
ncbi:MAG TPA: alpha/beta hydrolase, partial [Thermoanaerobaculia bacterium]|nr:alpha/beta hydrolase [Thermoanaerobaculia bacterium]